MRIKKTSATTPTNAKVVNAYSTSTVDTYSSNYINNSNKYSTTEVKTNKVWIDGKPIYRKMIQISVGTTDTSYTIANNISQAWIDLGNSWCTWGGNRTYPLSRLMTEYYIDNSLNLVLKSTNGTNTGYVTVEYTKTTD